MDTRENYIKQWKDLVLAAASALNEGDYDYYDNLMNNAQNIVDDLKREDNLTYECVNFGMSNYIFTDALPELFKHNKKVIKEFTETIKKDKNLSNQFKFIQAINNCNNNINAKDFIIEALDLFKSNTDNKTIGESNKKLSDIIEKYNIKPQSEIPESELQFFESCDFLFKNNKKLNNLSKINENIEFLVSKIKNNKLQELDEKINFDKQIYDFDKKYNKILTVEEKNLVSELVNNSNPTKQEDLFNEIKKDCLSIVNKLIENVVNDEKEELELIREQISSKRFNQVTLISDVAKLLEIKDILCDE